MTTVIQPAIPVLRIFQEDLARQFYLDFLGMQVDWEHRFAPDAPLYMQVSRSGLTLHLSEHYGDGSPGARVFVWMTGIEEFHRDLISQQARFQRPGLETTFYETRCVEVTDPFGNKILFNERLNSKGN